MNRMPRTHIISPTLPTKKEVEKWILTVKEYPETLPERAKELARLDELMKKIEKKQFTP